MSHALLMVQYPPSFAAVRAANKRQPSQPPRKTQRQKPATTTSHGFGTEKKAPVWQYVESCGAYCKLDKGPTFPSPEEIFDDPSDIEVKFLHTGCSDSVCSCVVAEEVKDMFVDDSDLRLCFLDFMMFNCGYDVCTKTWLAKMDGAYTMIRAEENVRFMLYVDFSERPYFCRVEPEIFDTLYGIDKKRFNKEACSCCADTIKAVYGANSQELGKFNNAVWSSSPK